MIADHAPDDVAVLGPVVQFAVVVVQVASVVAVRHAHACKGQIT